jgi:hypothetical protein
VVTRVCLVHQNLLACQSAAPRDDPPAEAALWPAAAAAYDCRMRDREPRLSTACVFLRCGWLAVAWIAAAGCEVREELVEPSRATADRLLRAEALASGGLLGAAKGGSVADRESIEYVESLPAARGRATSDARPVLVVCRAAWCRWSTEIAQGALADPRVVALSRRFVCVMLDADRHADACRGLSVTAFPTVLILAADGTERSRTVGRPPAESLVAAMESGLSSSVAAGGSATRR